MKKSNETCKQNEALDTVNCKMIDKTSCRSPYFQGRLLQTIFTFSQAGIITSSTLVDLTCRNTWCDTDWRKRPKASILKIQLKEQNFIEKRNPVVAFPTYPGHGLSLAHEISTGATYLDHSTRLPAHTSTPYPFDERRQYSACPGVKPFSSCRFEITNQHNNAFSGCAVSSTLHSFSGYPALNMSGQLRSHGICTENTDNYSFAQHSPFSHLKERTVWNYVNERSCNYKLCQPDMLMSKYKLQECGFTSVFDPGTAQTNESFKTLISPPKSTNEREKIKTSSNLSADKKGISADDENGDQELECPHCNIKCSNSGQLTGHIRMHTGEKPYLCTVTSCGKRFARNEELTRHLRIHTGYRPFVCCQCNKRFSRKDHLNKHVRTHLLSYEKRTHICHLAECGQRYSRSDALARHQWAIHGIKPKSSKNQDQAEDNKIA